MDRAQFAFSKATLLYLQAERKMVQTLKYILLWFENLSRLNFFFDKSEMVALNISQQEGEIVATQVVNL